MGQVGDDDGCVVKVRGLPWSTTEEDVVKFFNECNIRGGKNGVQMTLSREGRPSGEAYIEMDTPEDVELACKRDRDYMGHRYIEVFKANRSEMEWVVQRCGHNMEESRGDACVRLRGLPFQCNVDEIIGFFKGLEIVGNGIILAKESSGRPTGEAYVQFINKETAEKALQRHKDKIGHRYIEIFRSSIAEAKLAAGPKMRSRGFMGSQRHMPYDRSERFGGMNRYGGMGGGMSRGGPPPRGPGSFRGGFSDMDNGGGWGSDSGGGGGGGGGGMWDRPGGRGGPPRPLMDGPMDRPMDRFGGPDGGWDEDDCSEDIHVVHMRGLPFRATQADIADFFRPILPVNIRIQYDNSGRPSGEADVEFNCYEDAEKAMKKDKSHMQHRYIELFLDGPPSDRGGYMGGGGGGGGGGGMGGRGGGGGGGNFRRF